jgi:hypothetical protein
MDLSKFHMNLIHFPAFGRIRLHFCINETGKSHQHFFWKGKKKIKIAVAVFSGGGGCSVRAHNTRCDKHGLLDLPHKLPRLKPHV